ncbi:MAG: nicotinate-nicotinamide nucleotide adenylyltransferase [Brevinema sp.]
MRNIFIFGGSFDPIHQGHEDLIKCAVPLADELRIVPAGFNPDGKTYFFSNEERLLLVKASLGLLTPEDCSVWKIPANLLLEPLSLKIVVRTDEFLSQVKAHTIDLIRLFQQDDGDVRYHVIIGADQAQNFSHWKEPQELARLVTLWTVPRAGFTPDPAYEWNFLPFEEKNISSTKIRQCLVDKIPCTDVSPLVLWLARQFIDKKKMF